MVSQAPCLVPSNLSITINISLICLPLCYFNDLELMRIGNPTLTIGHEQTKQNSIQQRKPKFKYWCTQASSTQAILSGTRREETLWLLQITVCPSDHKMLSLSYLETRLIQLPDRRQNLMFPGGEEQASISNDLESRSSLESSLRRDWGGLF